VEANRERVLALTPPAGDDLIGHMYFHPWFGPRTHEIGWVVAPPHQRLGYATEAARALLRHAFETLHLHRVIATCETDNLASVGVMEKLGMRREAHFRQCYLRDDGSWSDEFFYALLAEEWFARATER
jgi:ribosomal-protein-alanine N-acetyltransferase